MNFFLVAKVNLQQYERFFNDSAKKLLFKKMVLIDWKITNLQSVNRPPGSLFVHKATTPELPNSDFSAN